MRTILSKAIQLVHPLMTQNLMKKKKTGILMTRSFAFSNTAFM